MIEYLITEFFIQCNYCLSKSSDFCEIFREAKFYNLIIVLEIRTISIESNYEQCRISGIFCDMYVALIMTHRWFLLRSEKSSLISLSNDSIPKVIADMARTFIINPVTNPTLLYFDY